MSRPILRRLRNKILPVQQKQADQTTLASDSGHTQSQPSRLCNACLSVLTRNDLELEKFYPHHNGLGDFIEASQIRCHICSWLCDALSEDDQERLRLVAEGKMSDSMISQETDPITLNPRTELLDHIQNDGMRGKWDESVSWVSLTGMRIETYTYNALSILVRLNPNHEGYFPSATNVYDCWLRNLWINVTTCMRYDHDPRIMTHQGILDLGLVTTELPSNTESMDTWATVEGWIQNCATEHRCLSQIDPAWYPTRLVERISSEMFRVIRSDSGSFQARRGYITLSHRWGDDDFVKLTTSNLSALESGSPVAILRKTFQDAMIIAHRMGVSYIWIDSLCIIQSGDDGIDWQQESATMAQVYSNSLCNISANWGDESNGLFFERTPVFEPPYSLYMKWKPPETSPSSAVLRLPQNDGLWYIIHRRGWSENVMRSPLNRRGWVLQERLLAPCVLHFSPQQVSWECGQKFAWEQIPTGFDNSADHALSYGLYECFYTCDTMARLKLHEPDTALDWASLVKEFTRCGLTKQSDRLVAIAGIAKVLASSVKDQYVAGIWTKDLPLALTWRKWWERKFSPTAQYYTPSFSWAAAEGAVEWRAYKWNAKSVSATFIKYREKPPSSAMDSMLRAEIRDEVLFHHVFGPITSPEVEVRMQGILRSCRRFPINPFARVNNSFYPSTGIEDSALISGHGDGAAFDVDYDRAAEGDAELDTFMYYYTIISYVPQQNDERTASDDSYILAEGLLLKSVDPSMGRFERVGYILRLRWAWCGHEKFELVDIRLPLGNEQELPAWSYDETTGLHTFYII